MQTKKRRWNLRIIIAVVIIIIAAVAVFVWIKMSGGDKPIIWTKPVERGTVTASVSANGVLQPLTTVEVKSNVGGQIVKLAVDEGDVVKAGQLIATIDPTDTRTAYEQSQADLAAAVSKVQQAQQQLGMDYLQNNAQVASARQALLTAKTKLLQAQEQAKVQPTLTQAAIKQAKNSYQAALAALDQTTSALTPQKLASAQNAYDEAQANSVTAQADYSRQQDLLAKGYVAKSLVETAQAKYQVAQAQLATAKNKLDTIKAETDQDLLSAQARMEQAKAQLDDANANSVQDKLKQQEVASAQAAVKQAQAALDVTIAATTNNAIRKGDVIQANAQVTRSTAAFQNAKTQLGYTTVVAPGAGIVTKKYVEAGSIVTAGKSSFSGSGTGVAIVDIADISRMFVLVNVDETDIASIEVGQKVDVTIEAYPDELFDGKVTKIAPQSVTDQNVTTIPVTVEVELPDQRLKPGMNATCDFITGRVENVLMVPNEAITETDNGSTVTVVDKNGKQTKVNVEVGLLGNDSTEIKKGLKEGQTIVTAIIQPTTSSNSQSSAATGAGARPAGIGGPGGPGGMGGMGGGGRGR